jgi:hypothetical protein
MPFSITRRAVLSFGLSSLGLEAFHIGNSLVPDPRYAVRLRRELDVLRELGALSVFVHAHAVADDIRQRGLALGPGNSTTGNSLLAMKLGLTQIDPIRHNLMFERFARRSSTSRVRVCLAVEPRAYELGCARLKRIYGAPVISDFAKVGVQDAEFSETPIGPSVSLWCEPDLEGFEPIHESRLDSYLSDPHIIEQFTCGDVDDLPGMQWPDPWNCEVVPFSETLRAVAPRSFDEVVAACAAHSSYAYQAGLTEKFIRRQQGKASEPSDLTVLDSHPIAARVLKPTSGSLVFQEQVTQIISQTKGLGLSFSEQVRRHMCHRQWEAPKNRVLVVQVVEAARTQGHDRAGTEALLQVLGERARFTMARASVMGEVMLAWVFAARRLPSRHRV